MPRRVQERVNTRPQEPGFIPRPIFISACLDDWKRDRVYNVRWLETESCGIWGTTGTLARRTRRYPLSLLARWLLMRNRSFTDWFSHHRVDEHFTLATLSYVFHCWDALFGQTRIVKHQLNVDTSESLSKSISSPGGLQENLLFDATDYDGLPARACFQ